MATTYALINRDTGKVVGRVDSDAQTVQQVAPDAPGSEYVPTGQVTLFTASDPTAENAFADETRESGLTDAELRQQLRDDVAGTPLEVVTE